MRPDEANIRFSDALLAGLVASGVRQAVVSPGSRSSPLALACARRPELRAEVILDERSAAFVAGGIARASGRPVALICTSGTAVANWLPGVVESSQAGLPLILLSADRPPELRDCGAPQTIDQTRIFGNFVRWYHEAPLPDSLADPEEAGRWLARQALSRSRNGMPGPVHLNLPFREPLVPGMLPETSPVVMDGSVPEALTAGENGDAARIAQLIRRHRRGWIVAGPLPAALRQAASLFARATGYPVLADAASNLRYGTGLDVCAASDAWIRTAPGECAPELIVRLGGLPSSKMLNQFIDRSAARKLLVAVSPSDGDPARQAEEFRFGDPAQALTVLAGMLAGSAAKPAPEQGLELSAAEEIAGVLDGLGELSEPGIARILIDSVPDGSAVFVSNSMPVRDLDWFSGQSLKRIDVYSNRGANGIDGITSSALGVALGSGRPVVLLTGDLAAVHDSAALAAAASSDARLTVLVVNNSGGGIFRHLPVSRFGAAFDRYFLTPQTVDFGHLAAAFGIRFHRAGTPAGLKRLLAETGTGIRLIEAPVNGEESLKIRQRIWAAVAGRLAPEARKAVAG